MDTIRDTVSEIKTFFYTIESPTNGIEYWELNLTYYNDSFYGGAKCTNFNLHVGWKNLKVQDDKSAAQIIINKIKENLL
ncbi:hypothetical protein PDN41_27430 [Bacillus cereus]|uniref:Uncharacterized protein n=1 Tax=Bacillus cereus (strain VD014) TaxID=1053223 RepID=A0A9W5NM40_BACC8|nr:MULTISPECIES: hypothetical protein [Bacillus cereus group]MRD38199.1 hypothetical protein [Bacillus thuringiensis]EJR11762.1 hypothetical protein IIA_05869 [Bacillus cereus VD014]KAA0806747.1 hypothetical protein DN403_29545 [Bacillus sp. AY2-1]MBJ7939276.1 hypothetical protein [Bacillus cereus]MDA2385384.1 hypothetical protein [Bacillus cereus]